MFVFRPFLVNLCGRLSRELSIVEVSGLNHFLAPAILQLTYISVLSFCARIRGLKSGYICLFFTILVKLCGMLFSELSIVEGSGLNNFVGIVALHLTIISNLTVLAIRWRKPQLLKTTGS